MISDAGIKADDISLAGIAANGSCEALSAVVSDIEKSIGVKCIAGSIADAKALGEAYILNDTDSLVFLKIDDTVESGIVIDKKIYTGAKNQRGNVAHMVINFDGFECACVNKGCFEAYANNSGLSCIAAECGITSSITHAQLFAMNTPEAKKAQKLYVEYLAAGITNIINLFQPRHLVLEGPFSEAGDALMTPMMDIILREQYTHSMPNKCDIRFANTDADTALIGAALLGR